MDTNKHSPRPSNMALTANISMELLDKDGNVLDAQYGHNLVINDGLQWFFKRAFDGIAGAPSLGGSLATSAYAIILGTGLGENFYIPAPADRVLRQAAAELLVITSLDASYDSTLQQISFVGQLEITMAGDVKFIKEMSLGVMEGAGAQEAGGTNYRLLNISSNPPNRDYSLISTGSVRAGVIFRLISN